jgi:glyoxylase-like metal-dependent hydrolase (beta-lactamase superfamily II)
VRARIKPNHITFDDKHERSEIMPIRLSDNYIWTMRDATSAAVVDPGDANPVIDHLDREGQQLVAIVNTRQHADHVGGNRDLLQPWKAECSSRMTTASRRTLPALRAKKITLPHYRTEFEIMEIPGNTKAIYPFTAEAHSSAATRFCRRMRASLRGHSGADGRFSQSARSHTR